MYARIKNAPRMSTGKISELFWGRDILCTFRLPSEKMTEFSTAIVTIVGEEPDDTNGNPDKYNEIYNIEDIDEGKYGSICSMSLSWAREELEDTSFINHLLEFKKYIKENYPTDYDKMEVWLNDNERI